jgi:hypothetical protein
MTHHIQLNNKSFSKFVILDNFVGWWSNMAGHGIVMWAVYKLKDSHLLLLSATTI